MKSVLLPLVKAILVLGAAVPAPGASSPKPTGQALDSLVAAERAFSRLSVEQGMRAAFLANLAENGIVFQPLPVNGREAWEKRAPSKDTLIWEPQFAEIAAAGDLGYTTGPWELRPSPEAKDRPVAHGHFISVWRRAKNGHWEVVVDLGTSHAAFESGVGSGVFAAGPRPVATDGTDRRRAAESEIREAENRMAKAGEKDGLAAAVSASAAEQVRFNRNGSLPALGPRETRELLAAERGTVRWTPRTVGASRSGDLGYACGIRERLDSGGAVADTSVYLDVWRRGTDGHWWLVVGVDNPVVRRSGQ